jgi:hypothetical protein
MTSRRNAPIAKMYRAIREPTARRYDLRLQATHACCRKQVGILTPGRFLIILSCLKSGKCSPISLFFRGPPRIADSVDEFIRAVDATMEEAGRNQD